MKRSVGRRRRAVVGAGDRRASARGSPQVPDRAVRVADRRAAGDVARRATSSPASSRMRAISCGWAARNARMNQRSITPSAIVAMPAGVHGADARVPPFQALPILRRGVGEHQRSMRGGAASASHMPIMPPIDSPQKCARSSAEHDRAARRHRAPSAAIEYGAGVRRRLRRGRACRSAARGSARISAGTCGPTCRGRCRASSTA